MRLRPLLPCLVLLLALAGCGSNTRPAQNHDPVSLQILPDSTGLAPGEQYAFVARVTDGTGAEVSVPVHWSVADTSIASIDSTGHARGRAAGRTQVEARTSTLRDSALLRVETGAMPTVFLEVYPATATYLAGDQQPYLVDVHDGDGKFVAAAIEWSTSNPDVASIDSSGEVHCKHAGTTEVRARSGDAHAEALLTVVAGATVSSVAGDQFPGFQDGAASAALFNLPFSLAEDSLGALYVADAFNGRVRVIENGQVRSLPASSLNVPTGVAVGPGRRIYVADQGNNVIRRYNPDGSTTILAGTGLAGYRDGAGSQALFDHPTGVVVDAGGTIFVADKYNHVIRVIDPAGEVRTLCGTSRTRGHQDGAPGLMDEPVALLLGPSHTLYVCERGPEGSSIRKITYDLTVPVLQAIETVSGNGVAGYANGLGQRPQFNQPYGVALGNDGWVYVADSGNRRIRAISPSGQTFNVAGTGQAGVDDGAAETSTWRYPAGLLFSGGDLLVADANGEKIRRIHGLLHVQAPAWTERARELMALRSKRPGRSGPRVPDAVLGGR